MKTIVCVKEVDGEINPFDACALESALKIENNHITVVSMGRKSVENLLQRLSRLNIEKAVLLTDVKFAGADTLATAKTLAKFIKNENPDLVMCGRQSIDGDTAQTGACISGILGYNVITNILSFDEISENGIKCTTRLGEEKSDFPLVATVERINTLRFPSIRSKPKDVITLSMADLGLDENECGLKGSPTRVIETFESALGRRKCKFISANEIFDIIKSSSYAEKSDAQVDIKNTDKRLPVVYAVGEAVAEKVKNIAERVELINETDPKIIVDIIKNKGAEFVFFPSDIKGRRTAPIVQAALKTGLCADCTRLETDGKKLFMYRPAFSGSLIAKIECKTSPVLATVRTEEKSSDKVILSVGLGALDYVEKLKSSADNNGWQFAASRGLVDKTGLDYKYQVGLTGKMVSPKVYIACGISGAVHHTCGIENAETVIAINTDKDARIFDYADYGVIADIKDIF